MNFYVYELIDPRNNLPFYIGKGTGNRVYYHLQNNTKIENIYKQNIINSLYKQNLNPIINIIKYFENENDAYIYESTLIKKYGRKGYDENGILSNICLDNRPPNHKNKTYIEIYGSEEKAKEQIEKRRLLQISAGGYGPSKHTEETKRKISQSITGDKNPMYGKKHTEETKKKISIANKGKGSGSNNPNAKLFKVVSSDNKIYIIHGTLKKFCEYMQFSYATAQKIVKTRKTVRSGMLKDWMITEIKEEEMKNIDNYILVDNEYFINKDI